ncbi:MAG TPA: GvpL/GvpF family gas vesicle protein [Vicinamibacterales bacterium]|nr:GvpL/GvpF family gas vesicle protein [Vicinamibacterales bacterium]
MILYLYALAEGLSDVSGLAAPHDAPIILLPFKHLVAASWLAAAPPVSKESLTAQDRLVRELHAHATALLPMRYGTAVADTDAADAAIKKLGDAIGERLALVRGREQMTLRVFEAGPPARRQGRVDDVSLEPPGIVSRATADAAVPVDASIGAGTSYLAGRAALTAPPQAVRALLDAVSHLQRAVRVEAAKRGDAWTIYHLIDRGGGDDYRRVAAAAAAAIPLHIVVTGPSPCYAF